MAAHSELCFLVFIVLLCPGTVSPPVTEQICITVTSGENASLPLELPVNTTDFVKIKKDGLEKDIFCERDGHEVPPPDVDLTYWTRVKRVGNKFILKNVSGQDSGEYSVSYKDEKGEHNVTFILFVVNKVELWGVGVRVGVGCVILAIIISVGVVVYFVKNRRRRKKRPSGRDGPEAAELNPQPGVPVVSCSFDSYLQKIEMKVKSILRANEE